MMDELWLTEADVVHYGAQCARDEWLDIIVGPYLYAALKRCYEHWEAQQRLDNDGCPLHVVQR